MNDTVWISPWITFNIALEKRLLCKLDLHNKWIIAKQTGCKLLGCYYTVEARMKTNLNFKTAILSQVWENKTFEAKS